MTENIETILGKLIKKHEQFGQFIGKQPVVWLIASALFGAFVMAYNK
jgi:hypothetical protein